MRIFFYSRQHYWGNPEAIRSVLSVSVIKVTRPGVTPISCTLFITALFPGEVVLGRHGEKVKISRKEVKIYTITWV